MRVLSYEHKGRQSLGLLVGDTVVNLAESASATGYTGAAFSDMHSLLNAGGAALEIARELASGFAAAHVEGIPVEDVRVLAPVPHPSKVIAIGLNYKDHANEAGFKLPQEPLLFAKFPSSLCGPYDDIVLPQDDPQADFEVELAVVIGKKAKRIAAADAERYIAGYMVLNDVSARRFQFGDKQWTRGKSCDTFCPVGPWLTTADEIPDPHLLRVVTRLNGEVLQDSNTANLIFRVPELIAYITRSITLFPGDIIATGTPPGVGVFRDPQRFLQPGDVLETEVEMLGTMRNPVVAETADS